MRKVFPIPCGRFKEQFRLDWHKKRYFDAARVIITNDNRKLI
jgi:hypothetical protein